MTSAQVVDSGACRQACHEQKERCVSACDDKTDPMECETRCYDALLGCLKQCG